MYSFYLSVMPPTASSPPDARRGLHILRSPPASCPLEVALDLPVADRPQRRRVRSVPGG
jgi:hypothetical protein